MLTRGVYKRISYLLVIIIFFTNFNLGNAVSVREQYRVELPVTQPSESKLSVPASIYATPDKSTVTSSIYLVSSTPIEPFITPTLSSAIATTSAYNPTPTLAPTSSLTSTPKDTSTLASPTNTPVPANDDYGDNILNAYPISEKSNVYGILGKPSDVDVFSLTSKLDCDIVFTLNNTYNISRTILDYRGDYIDSQFTYDSDDINGTKGFIKFHALKNMKYYLKLVNYSQEVLNYSFCFDYLVDDYSNTFNDATAITIGETITGNLIDDADIDTFKLTAPKSGVYIIEYTKNKCSFSVFDENNNKQTISCDYIQLNSGQNYYIKVGKNSEYNNTYYYNLKIKGPTSDDYGNGMESSTKIESDCLVNGKMDYSTDKDFFSFTPSEGGLYFIYGIYKTPNYNPNQIDRYSGGYIKVFDSEGNLIDYNYYDQSLSYMLNKDATYYISFSTDDYTGLMYAYSFKLKLKAPDDNDNSMASAKSISLNETINGAINPLSDMDYYVFRPSSAGTYCINFNSMLDFRSDLSNFPNPYFVDAVRVYDAAGNILLNSNYYYDTKDYFYLEKDKNYYISISDIRYYPIFNYTLNVDGPVYDDYGNRMESAKEIQVGKMIYGKTDYYNDVDYFYFKPTIDGIYYIGDNSQKQDNDPQSTWQVYDADGNVVNTKSSGNKLNFTVKRDKVYYLSVNRNYSTIIGDYAFTLSGPVVDDIGDTIETAKELHINDSVTVVSDYYGDKDYLSLTPSEDGLYCFDLTLSRNVDYDLYSDLKNIKIIDSNNNEINSSLIGSKLYFRLYKNNKYYANISADCNNTNYPTSFSFLFSGPLADDYGNSKDTAYTVDLMKKIEGFADSQSDKDYFKITVPEDGVYKIDYSYLTDYSQQLSFSNLFCVLDNSGKRLEQGYNNKAAYLELKKDDTYYLVANYYNYNSFIYKYSFIISECTDDFSNSTQNASEIKLGSEVKGKLEYYFDSDYFKFTPSESGAYYLSDIKMTSSEDGADYSTFYSMIGITGSDKSIIETENPNDSKILFNLYKGNTYYIYLSGQGVLLDYSFKLNGPIHDDYGDTFSYSKNLAPGEKIEGNIEFYHDRDCFSFKTTCKGLYHISTTGGVSFSLVDKNYSTVSECPINLDNKEHYYYLPANETYYIDLESDKITDYSLEISEPFYDDYANIINDGTIVRIDTPVKGAIDYNGDIDILKILPQSTGDLFFKFDAPSNLSFKVLDSDDVNIGYTSVGGNIYSINLKELENLTIQIESYDALLKGEYTFTASDNPENITGNKNASTVTSSVYSMNSSQIQSPDMSSTLVSSETDDFGNNILDAYQILDKSNVTGKLETQSDIDVFKFYSENDAYTIVAISPSNGITPSVLDYRGKRMDCDVINGYQDIDGSKTLIKFYTEKNMKYFIKIGTYLNESTPYTFNLSQLVDDYSDDFEASEIISSGDIINGNFVDENDVDVFKFTPKADGIYNFHKLLNNCEIKILDENKNYLYITSNYIFLTSGKTYYITLQKNRNYTSAFSYGFKIVGPIKDDFGDSKENSRHIELNTIVNGSIDHSFDKDYFSFAAPASGIYQIHDFTTSYSSYPFYDTYLNKCLRVYDSNGYLVDFSYYNAKDAYLTLKEGSVYFISLSTIQSMELVYTYSFTIKSPIVDDVGNTMQYSKEIQSDVINTGNISDYYDVDYFKFIPSSDGEYCIDMTPYFDANTYNKPLIGRIINVYDNMGNLMFIKSDDNNSKAYAHFNKGAQYYISVSSDAACSVFEYSFSVKGPINDDYGDLKDNATEVQAGKEIEGRVDYYNDSDYFYFKPSMDGVYIFKHHLLEGYSNNWYIRNSNDNVLSSNTYYPDNFIARKGEVYYIEIIKDVNDTSPLYSFSIEGPVKDDFGDSKELAKELQINTPITVTSDYYGDKDYMKFSSSEEGLYFIDLSSDVDISSFTNDTKIFDSNENRIYYYLIDSRLYLTLNKQSTYYILISSYSTPQKYSFTIMGPIKDDYGNIKESAYKIQLDQKVEGLSESKDDVDYFSFIPASDGIYKLDLRIGNIIYNTYNFGVLNIIDIDGNKIPVNYTGSSAFFQLNKENKYYLVVSNANYYSIFKYSFVVSGPIVDDYGNSPETSQEIMLDQEVKGDVNYIFDSDYFKFTPLYSGTYFIDSATINNSEVYSILKITDSCGNRVNFGMDSSDAPRVFFTLQKGRTYYMCMTISSNYRVYNYSFSIKGPTEDDIGNTPTYSTTIKSGNKIVGKFDYINDIDYFNFTTVSEGLYKISKPDNVILKVYDSTNKEICIYPTYIYNSKTNYYYLKGDETYYISASNINNNLETYSIIINDPIADDFPDTIIDALTLKVNSPVSGKINFTGDEDMFKFDAEEVGNVYIKFDGPEYFSVDVMDGLYGNLIDYKYIKDNVICINPTNKVFDIKISSYDKALTGDYTITVSDKLESLIDNTFKLSGYISSESVNNSKSPSKAGFVVALKDTNLSSVTDENGYFEIKNAPINSTKEYSISISKDGYLKRDIEGIIAESDGLISTLNSPIEIWAGDINTPSDNKINMLDVICLSKVFNSIKGDGIYYESADINKDNVINIMDVIIMAKHFNQTSSDYSVIN
ncbi:MAG: hypothetical protein Q8942_04465 [Bacillota bacterium]|nr:hypothetical protein [Bacillota bacterium]